MVSLLSNIEAYAKEKDPTFRSKRITYNLLPIYYNQAILYALRSIMKDRGVSVGPKKYTIAVDENGKARIEVPQTDTYLFPGETEESTPHNMLYIVGDKEGHIDENNNAFFPESLIYEFASFLEQNKDLHEAYKTWFDKKYEGQQGKEAEKLYEIYKNMSEYMYKSLYENGEEYLDNPGLDHALSVASAKIIQKIAKTKKWYDEQIAKLEMFTYVPKEDKTSTSSGSTSKKASGSYLDVTISLPKEDRYLALKQQRPRKEFLLTTPKRHNPTDYVLYYKNGSDNILIIEPVNGNRATRIIFLDKDELKNKNISELAVYYASLSPNEFSELNNTVKTNHTSLETFDRNLDYIVAYINDGVNPPLKHKIDIARLHKGKTSKAQNEDNNELDADNDMLMDENETGEELNQLIDDEDEYTVPVKRA